MNQKKKLNFLKFQRKKLKHIPPHPLLGLESEEKYKEEVTHVPEHHKKKEDSQSSESASSSTSSSISEEEEVEEEFIEPTII